MKRKNILFGAAYYDEYMPYDRIETDMELMKSAGMNVIRIAESTWSTWEPSEGVFDFTHLHRMLDAAEKYDMQVIVGTPTYAIPAWLAKKAPDIMALTPEGQNLYGHRQLHDITNPVFLYYAERIIRKLMEEVKDHPNVIGYQLDNETRSAEAASPETQKLFVKTMQKKYPDINDFNHEFGLDYWSNKISCWEDFPDIRGTINGSLSAAYKRFLRDCITNYLTWQSEIVKEYKRPEQFITHNFDYNWIEYSYGIQPLVNQFDAAKCMDVAGVDIYHLSQDKLTGAEIAFGGAVGYTLKKGNYLVLETQSQGRLDWLPFPGQLRLQAFSHLAAGANSVMYWNWHSIHNSFESYWRGILSHNLKPNAAYKELSAFGQEIKPLEKHLINLKIKNRAAIIIDNASLTGLDEFPVNDQLDYNHILRHVYDVCYEMNLECDLLSVNDNFEDYDMLIAPALYSATEETIKKIDNYVKNGGHLLMGYRSCFSDEELKIYHDNQPHMLTECIGATYDTFTIPADTGLSFREDRFTGLTCADCQAEDWMELLIPDNAEVWAYYHHPYWNTYAAVTHNKYGNGTATYVGCHMSKKALSAVVKAVADCASVNLPDYAFPVIRKQGINDAGKHIIYYFNYSSKPVTIDYDGKSGTNLIENKKIMPGTKITLGDWNLAIIEED